MGLFRDLLIKDIRKKRRVTIFIHIVVILIFVLTIFLHTFDGLAYEQGYEFGTKTCIAKFEELYKNMSVFNKTGDFDVIHGEIPET